MTELPCRNIVLRQPRLSSWFIGLGFFLLVVVLPFAGAMIGWIGALAAILASLGAFVQSARVQSMGRAGGTVALVPGALRIVDGASRTRLVPFTEIESGYETPSDGTAVLLLRGGGQLFLRLSHDPPARVLEHVGVGTTQRVLTLPLRGQLGAFTIGFVSFFPLIFGWSTLTSALGPALLGASPGSAFLLAMAMTFLSTALVVARFGFPRVVVGTDGIRVLGVRRRFFPHETIAQVELVPSGYGHSPPVIRLRFHGRAPFVLPTIAAPAERIEGLARRIDEAARAHAGGAARPLEALARGGRSIETWKTDVARMALAPPGFRDHALGPEDFERVLADAAAPPDQRIGAALALRAIDPDAGPARIRVAADASADDALREALASAAEGEIDDELLVRAAARRAVR